MCDASYRLRRPVWLWAVIGPLAAGIPAAIVVGIVLIIVGDDIPALIRSGSFDISWYMIWPGGVIFSIIFSLPAILAVALVSLRVFPRVRGRRAAGRSDIFIGYRKYAWIGLALSPLLFTIWAMFALFQKTGRFVRVHDLDLTHVELFLRSLRRDLPELAFSTLMLLLATLFAALIARPLFFRVVTQRLEGKETAEGEKEGG